MSIVCNEEQTVRTFTQCLRSLLEISQVVHHFSNNLWHELSSTVIVTVVVFLPADRHEGAECDRDAGVQEAADHARHAGRQDDSQD